MSIITIGIDLAKNVFAVHGVNESGKAELVKPKVPRDQLLPLIACESAFLIFQYFKNKHRGKIAQTACDQAWHQHGW